MTGAFRFRQVPPDVVSVTVKFIASALFSVESDCSDVVVALHLFSKT